MRHLTIKNHMGNGWSVEESEESVHLKYMDEIILPSRLDVSINCTDDVLFYANARKALDFTYYKISPHSKLNYNHYEWALSLFKSCEHRENWKIDDFDGYLMSMHGGFRAQCCNEHIDNFEFESIMIPHQDFIPVDLCFNVWIKDLLLENELIESYKNNLISCSISRSKSNENKPMKKTSKEKRVERLNDKLSLYNKGNIKN